MELSKNEKGLEKAKLFQKNKGKYFYGIIERYKEKEFGSMGLFNSPLHTVCYKDIAALVSNSPMLIDITKENAFLHDKVVRSVMKDSAIIPMGFGTVAAEEDIKRILEVSYEQFKNIFKKINNKIQVDVKAVWNEREMLIEVLNENSEIRKLWKQAKENKQVQQQENLNKSEIGKKTKLILDEKKEYYAQEIQSPLQNFPVIFKANKLPDEKTIMNTSFLIDKDKEKEFYDKVDELDDGYGKKIEVISIGPLPPYNFTCLEAKKIEFERLDSARRLLNLGEEASLPEVETAYSSLAAKYHPDKNPDNPAAKEQFKKVGKAYALLADYCRLYPASKCSFRREDIEKVMLIKEKEDDSYWQGKYKIEGSGEDLKIVAKE